MNRGEGLPIADVRRNIEVPVISKIKTCDLT